MQIRTSSGNSFFEFATLQPARITDISSALADQERIDWRRRIWVRKERDITLNEIVGYQIAHALRLPVQPWLAFFRSGKHNDQVGMLIERWHSSISGDICSPAKQQPELVALALAFCVLDRFEWPVWLVSEDGREFRLIDLERIGPVIRWPPQQTALRWYFKGTKASLREASTEANGHGLSDLFDDALRKLMHLDFATVVDLSGHPHGKALRKVLLQGLEGRQWELRRLIEGTVRPRKELPKRHRTITRRKLELTRVGTRHPQYGWLEGSIALHPAPRRKWTVRWDIGRIDLDMKLSTWFGRQAYATKLNNELSKLESQTPSLRLSSFGGVRWGSEKNMDERSARRLVDQIKQLWENALRDWEKRQNTKSVFPTT